MFVRNVLCFVRIKIKGDITGFFYIKRERERERERENLNLHAVLHHV